MNNTPIVERFWQKVTRTKNCWSWNGSTDRTGYGRFRNKRRMVMAHRYSYELTKGPIPEGLQLDHLCRFRSCVNPDHLEPVTNAENQRRGLKAAQTHCKQGHPFDERNTIIRKNGTSRDCRKCVNERSRVFIKTKRRIQRGAMFGKRLRKTHCHKGHAFDERNTIIKNHGGFQCRICCVERTRVWRVNHATSPKPPI